DRRSPAVEAACPKSRLEARHWPRATNDRQKEEQQGTRTRDRGRRGEATLSKKKRRRGPRRPAKVSKILGPESGPTFHGRSADLTTRISHGSSLIRLICAQSNYPVSDEQVNALWAAMAGMKPQDEIEGMLCGQMIATHQAIMECYR